MLGWAPPEWGYGPEFCEQACGEGCAAALSEEPFRCRREVLYVRPENVVAYECFTIAFGETAGFSENPIDLSVCLEILRYIEHRDLRMQSLRRVKILAEEYRKIRTAEREAEETRASMLNDLKNFVGMKR